MTAHESFFQKQQPAAVLKHKVLAEYTRVFATMVGSKSTLPIWIIDGYAGAGAYENGETEDSTTDGSPLVVLKMAQNLPSRDIRCAFIESDRFNAERLRSNVMPFVNSGMVANVLVGDVQDKIEQAWKTVGQSPVVTFLDPFGVAMRASTMTELLLAHRTNDEPSEVLLNINVEAVGRLGGLLQNDGGQVVPKDRQDASVARVDEFLGGTWWRKEFFEARLASGDSAAQAAASVIRSYRQQVEQATGRRSMSIEIRRRPSHQPLFLLTLFFRHPYAGYKFADAASRATKAWRNVYRRQEFEEFYDQPQQTLFGIEELEEDWERTVEQAETRLKEEWVDIVKNNLRRAIVDRPSLLLAENIETILGGAIGLAGEAHIRAAWKALAEEGVVQPRGKGNLYSARIHRA